MAEQRRIVAKVDELIAMCDRLEAAQAERERRRGSVIAASFTQTTSRRQPFDFQVTHLDRSATRSHHVDILRRAILTLAVSGRLVPQDPCDEQPHSLNVSTERSEDRIDVDLPNGWKWARVEDVANARLGKMLDKSKNRGRFYRYLRNTNVHWFDIRTSNLKEIRIEDDELEQYLLRDGDVMICEGGHGIGRTAVWRRQFPDVVFQKALHRVRPGKHLVSEFFAYATFVYFDSGVLHHYFTGVGIPHFTGKGLASLVFPLPPRAEQERIVVKVQQLMALCHQLESHITRAQIESRKLLDAILHETLQQSSVGQASIVSP